MAAPKPPKKILKNLDSTPSLKTFVKKIKVIKKTAPVKLKVKEIKTAPKKINKRIISKRVLILPKKKLASPHRAQKPIGLTKALHNPIIEPSLYSWESKATFNPAAIEHDGKVHLVYRAIGDDDSSVLGYASSHDGYNIYERPPHYMYKRTNLNCGAPDLTQPNIDYLSGGSWNGGCEDPRLTKIGRTIYMIYTAFDGWGSLRLAMTSIPLVDFVNKKFVWKNPVLISPPGEIHKNWVLFPEKINGKFAILHSFYPEIRIDYFDSLDALDGKKNFIKSNNTRPIDQNRTWDSWFRGVGPTPIKTDEGWLILYHAMDHKNPDRYRLGAVVLDLHNPTKILYRSDSPILEPEEHYENNGWKWGVVYACGAVVKRVKAEGSSKADEMLFVYYGGADKVVGVATIPLQELLADLKKHKVVKLKKQKVRI